MHRMTDLGRLAGAALVLALVLAAFPAHAQTARGPVVSDPIPAIRIDVSLNDLPLVEPWQPGDPIVIIPEADIEDPLEPMGAAVAAGPVPPPRGAAPPTNDIINVAGIPFQGFLPPDTVGAVGPNHYIQSTNASTVLIFDKAGNVVSGPFQMDSLAPGGDLCSSGLGDPIIIYDTLADRWVMSEFINPGAGNRFCIYVSQGPDPVNDGWFFYGVPQPVFPDYPKYAVWPDAYYISTYEGGLLGIHAIDRDPMLVGDPTTLVRFTIPSLTSAPRDTRILPAHYMAGNIPPKGTPNFHFRSVENLQGGGTGDRIEVWMFDVDFVTPANSVFDKIALIPDDFAFGSCGGAGAPRNCVPQPGTAIELDALPGRPLMHNQFRLLDNGDFMLLNQQPVDAGGDIWGTKWWELRFPAGAGPEGDWFVFQSGVHSPDDENRWMGSAAMNGDGTIAFGYSISGTVQPGIRWAARAASDPPGTVGEEFSVFEGQGIQTSTSRRWGDYSAMTVDPVDDTTFWYTNEYMNSSNQWATRVVAFTANGIFSDGFESGDVDNWDANAQ